MNCIFLCIFKNRNYIDMLFLLLRSLYKYGNINKNIEVLIYTNTEFSNIIKSSELYNSNVIKFETNDNINTMEQSFETRLYVFNLPSISKYEKILYLDTDILINKDINYVFELAKEEILYVVEEQNIDGADGYMFGGNLFTQDELNNYPDKSAFNSGVILFKNCEKIKTLFNNIVLDIKNRRNMNNFYDQPFIVYNAFKYNMFDNKIMKNYSTNYHHYENMDKIIHHFCGGPGEHSYKLVQMNKFMEHQISVYGR